MLARIIGNRARPSFSNVLQLVKVRQRALSINQTATALRPFFFAVHPDLFGRHPKERAVNEDSMKHLQQYLEGVRSQRRLPPTHLTFYIRDTQNGNNTNDRLQEVRISLSTNTVRDAVTTVLRSCNLSLEYLSTVPSNVGIGKQGRNRPIMWDPTFYTYYNIPNPFATRKRNKLEATLGSWLCRNIAKARKNLETVEPVRQQTTHMVAALKKETGLSAIRWECDWGMAQFRACLLSLRRLYEHHSSEINLAGETVVFGNQTGLCLRGAIILRIDDVPDHWLRVIKTTVIQKQLLEVIPEAEQELSNLLNNVGIHRQTKHPVVLAQEYLSQVHRLINSLQRLYQDQSEAALRGDFSHIKIVIKCATGSLMLSPEGHVLVPSSCPGFMIVDYLNKNVQKICHAQKDQQWSWREEEEFNEHIVAELSLLSLVRDKNVTWQQMRESCGRLLHNQSDIDVSLEGIRLRISHFYSVLSDGELCIPWDWKGSTDL